MITLEQYFGIYVSLRTPEFDQRASDLIDRVNNLLDSVARAGIQLKTNPATGSQISGQTLGGIRPLSCPQGSAKSSHKQAQGIDIYDVGDAIDAWITDAILMNHGLYREHPSATKGWVHLTTRPPPSGRTTFYP